MRKGILQGGIFLIVLGFTVAYVLRNSSPMEIAAAVQAATPAYLIAAVIVMCIYFLGEGMNITRGLQLMVQKPGPEVPEQADYDRQEQSCQLPLLCQGIKYALIGFFFSSVTPSASGGQPMQLYQMHRDGISAGHGTLILLLEFVSYQTVTVGLAVAGCLLQWENILNAMGDKLPYLLAGMFINVVTTILVYMLLFSSKVTAWMDRRKWISGKFGSAIHDYKQGARFIKAHKEKIFPYFLTTAIQMLAMYSVPYFVYLSFGLGVYSWIEIVSLQAVLYISVSALPIPGAMGISESGFVKLFRLLFPAELLTGAMVLSRGISFYLFVLISGCACSLLLVGKKSKIILRKRGVPLIEIEK